MPCPDEDDVAAFIEGSLGDARVAEIEQHLDTCAACSLLFANLGRAYGPSDAAGRLSTYRPATALVGQAAVEKKRELHRRVQRVNLELQLGACALHLVGAALWLPRFVTGGDTPLLGPLRSILSEPWATLGSLYLLLWAVGGIVWTLLNVALLRRQHPLARSSVLTYSMLSVLSLFGAIHGALGLYAFTRTPRTE